MTVLDSKLAAELRVTVRADLTGQSSESITTAPACKNWPRFSANEEN